MPYGIGVDKNGEAWAAGQGTNDLYRLNPTTGEVTAYPKGTMMYNQTRQLFVDNSTNPVTVWVPHNHQKRIAKVEPLD
jgi:streptogramin lyase